MQIVIDISEGFIDKMNSIKDDRELSWAQLLTVYRGFHAMLQNSTPLPKRHGRLIDADAVFDKMQSTFDMQDLYLPIHLKELIVDEMPTIIEADKEE